MARHTLDLSDMYVVQPLHPWWKTEQWAGAEPLPDGFRYSSDANPQRLTAEQLKAMVGETEG